MMTEETIDAPIDEPKPKKISKAKPTSATDKARAVTLAKMAAKQK